MAKLVIPRCSAPGCGKPLPPRCRRGPAARYCSAACRVAAYRARGAVIAAQFETAGDEWDDVETVATESMPPAPATSASTDEQVARAILEARAVAGSLLRLGHQARPEFAWRCERAGLAIAKALDTYFEGVS